MNPRSQFVVAPTKPSNWAGVYGYTPDTPRMLEKYGQMFTVVRMSADSTDIELDKIAKLIIEELQHRYFDDKNSEDSILMRLEDASWKMKAKLDLILSREPEIMEQGLDMEIGVVVLHEEYLYGLVIGESKLLILRNESLVDVSKALIDRDMAGLFKSGSLQIHEDDRLILMTENTADAADPSLYKLARTLDLEKLETFATKPGSSLVLIADENLEWKELPEAEVAVEEMVEENTVEEIDEPVDPYSHLVVNTGNGIEEDMDEIEDNSNANELPAQQEDTEDIRENTAEQTGSLGTIQEFEATENTTSQNPIQPISKPTMGREEVTRPEAEPEHLSKTDEFGFNPDADQEEAIDTEPNTFMSIVNTAQSKFQNGLGTLAARIKNVRNKSNTDSDQYEQQIYSEATEADDEESTIYDDPAYKGGGKLTSIVGRIQKGLLFIVNTIRTGIAGIANYFKNNQTTYVTFIRNLGKRFGLAGKRIRVWFMENIVGTRQNRFRGKSKIKRNRYLFGIAIIVLVIVLAVGGMQLNNDALERQQIEKDEGEVAGLQTEFSSISTEISTTGGSTTNTDAYLSRLNDLERRIKLYQDDTLQPDVLAELLTQIETKKDTLLKRERFTQPEIVADIGTTYADANLIDLEYAAGNLFITDSARNVVYKSGLQLNSQVTEHITGLTAPTLLEQNVAGEIVVYDSDANSSVGRFDPNTAESLARYPGLPTSEIGTVKEVAIYEGNDALYEVNSTHGQIFKRVRSGSDYIGGGSLYTSANPPNWKTDQKLKSAIDIEAPFDIYVLIDGVGVERYLGGGENTLPTSAYRNTPTEIVSALPTATALAVNGEYMVIGDSENNRVLLFKIIDDGTETYPVEFVKQYAYDGQQTIFNDIREVILEGSQIFVLDGSRVVRLGL